MVKFTLPVKGFCGRCLVYPLIHLSTYPDPEEIEEGGWERGGIDKGEERRQWKISYSGSLV
jgi:hypothetical protein